MSPKKLAAYIFLFIVFVIFLQWLAGFLSTGKLIVTTNSSSTDITLSARPGVSPVKKGFDKHAAGRLEISLKAGGYLVSVKSGTYLTSQYVKVKGHSTTRVSISPLAPTGVEPVTFDSAQDVVADRSSLVYLNIASSTINRIDNQNRVSKFPEDNYQFTTIKWADTSYGVGQNSQGQLFVINNNVIAPLRFSPIPSGGNPSVVFAVSPERNIYIGIGGIVFGGSEKYGFKQIYDKMMVNSELLAGANGVAIASSGYGSESASSSPSMVYITTKGKLYKTSLDSLVDGWSTWSKNNKHIVVAEQSAAVILDSSLHRVGVIPESNLANPTWLDDNTLLYNINDQLWSYDLRAQRSQLIANMPLGASIQQLSVSLDGSYVYMTTSDSDGNIAIRRVGLRGQKTPDYIFRLQDVLPQSDEGTGYSLGLVNFSGTPVIQVQPTGNIDPQSTLQSGKSDIQGYGFDTSKLSFNLVTSN